VRKNSSFCFFSRRASRRDLTRVSGFPGARFINWTFRGPETPSCSAVRCSQWLSITWGGVSMWRRWGAHTHDRIM